jgi:hypothetical protein
MKKTVLVDFKKFIDIKGATQTLTGKAEISYSLSDIQQFIEENNKIIDFKVTKYLAKTFN